MARKYLLLWESSLCDLLLESWESELSVAAAGEVSESCVDDESYVTDPEGFETSS